MTDVAELDERTRTELEAAAFRRWSSIPGASRGREHRPDEQDQPNQ